MILPALLLLGSCGIHRTEAEALADPSNPDAWEAAGDACRRGLKPRCAAEAYRTALQLDPERTELRSRLGGHRSPEARALMRAARRAPTDDELWGDLGDMLRMEEDLAGARDAYLHAFRLDPQDGEWQRALGELGDGEMVARMLQTRLDERDDESMGDYGDVLDNLGRSEEACEYWRRAAEIDPLDDEWVGHASSCGFQVPEGYALDTGSPDLYDTGRPPPRDDLESLLSRVSSDVGLLVRLGQAYLRAGETEKSVETLWGAILISPTDKEALQSYLIASGRTRRDVLETLRRTFPDDDEVAGLLGDHYLDLGLRDKARQLYGEAHEIDPADPEWEAKQRLLVHRP